MTINVSRDSEYHTQRNNRKYPHSACNVTSYVMAGKNAGHVIPGVPTGVQDEDYFMEYMRSPRMYEQLRDEFAWAFETQPDGTFNYFYPPSEIHVLLAQGFNELIGRDVARFSTNVMRGEIIQTLLNGGGIVLSGRFPYRGKSIGHMVSLAGFRTHQNRSVKIDPLSVQEWIIDDPYGDHRTSYTNHRGNDVPLTPFQWQTYLKIQEDMDSKFAHLITT